MSWWAVRVGKAKLAVPRMPLPGCVGRREAWLSFDPRVLREWATTPLALSLGLDAPCALESGRIMAPSLGTPCMWGRGTTRTGFRRPSGRHTWCPFDEFLPRHLQHVRDNLLDQLPELFGKTLVVDSITTFPSEGDALAGLVFEALSEQARAPRAASTHKSAKRLVNRSAGSFPKAPGIALAPLVDASQARSFPSTCAKRMCSLRYENSSRKIG